MARSSGRLSARVIAAVLGPPLRVLRRAAVRLFLYRAACVRGRAQGADAALLSAQRARQRERQRALVADVSEVVAVVTAELKGRLHRLQRGGSAREGEAVFLWQRPPHPPLFVVHQARKDVDPPLLSAF